VCPPRVADLQKPPEAIKSGSSTATSCDDWPYQNRRKSEEIDANLMIYKDFTRKPFKLKDLAGISR